MPRLRRFHPIAKVIVALLLLSGCGAFAQATPTFTPVPSSTFTPLPSETPLPLDTATPSATPTITATPEIHAEDLVAEGVPPPLDISLPENWTSRNIAVAIPDVDTELRPVYVAAYSGPVTGGTGSIVVLWDFPNFLSGDLFALPGTPTPAPDLWSDGLRLFRTAMVETGCNAGTDLQRSYTVGGLEGSGTQFAIVDCPESPDTRGWFVGLQEKGMNFVFYIYTEPIDAMDSAQAELQAILDTVKFRVEDSPGGG